MLAYQEPDMLRPDMVVLRYALCYDEFSFSQISTTLIVTILFRRLMIMNDLTRTRQTKLGRSGDANLQAIFLLTQTRRYRDVSPIPNQDHLQSPRQKKSVFRLSASCILYRSSTIAGIRYRYTDSVGLSVIRYHNKQQASPSGPPNEAYCISTRKCSIYLRMCTRRLLSTELVGRQLPTCRDTTLTSCEIAFFAHFRGNKLHKRLHLIVQRNFTNAAKDLL